MSGLKLRCRAFLEHSRSYPTVKDLEEFVIAERGRAADPSLADTAALVLYFKNKKDRAEFVEAFKSAKPGVITRRVP